MLTLAVLLIFAAMVAVIIWSANKDDSESRPILLHRDEQSLRHRRNLREPDDR